LDLRCYVDSVGWHAANLADFLNSGPAGGITLVYVHGNRFDPQKALHNGCLARQAMHARSTRDVPVRFVIWSWPSEQVPGVLRDVRLKAWRAHVEAFYLASFLSRLRSDTRVSLIGSSYGARVITGALHLRSGGVLEGRHLAKRAVASSARVVLMAAALDNDWLSAGGYHCGALSQINALLLYYNSNDPVLRKYRLLDRNDRSHALGFTGLTTPPPGLAMSRIRQADVSGFVGRSHREADYLSVPELMLAARGFLLWAPVE
jgi:hypothetical protein